MSCKSRLNFEISRFIEKAENIQTWGVSEQRRALEGKDCRALRGGSASIWASVGVARAFGPYSIELERFAGEHEGLTITPELSRFAGLPPLRCRSRSGFGATLGFSLSRESRVIFSTAAVGVVVGGLPANSGGSRGLP